MNVNKDVRSVEELISYAGENGYKLTEDEAKMYFNNLHKEGELADEELSNVAGGSTCINGRYYSDDPEGYLITTLGNTCDLYELASNPMSYDDGSCYHCKHSFAGDVAYYCGKRTRYKDPFNDEIGG